MIKVFSKSLIPTIKIATYPAVSNLENISRSFRKIPEVNLNANTPINAPNIINMYWSLIATAVVILSIENAKSVIERSATTFKNLKLFLLLSVPFSTFSESEFKKTLETNKYIK